MIVCHCNVINKAEIEGAVRSLLASDPGAPLEPQFIYRELQKRGQCCGCFPTVSAIVAQLLAEAMKEVDGAALGRVSALKELLPKES